MERASAGPHGSAVRAGHGVVKDRDIRGLCVGVGSDERASAGLSPIMGSLDVRERNGRWSFRSSVVKGHAYTMPGQQDTLMQAKVERPFARALLALLGWGVWLALGTWRLGSVPGMSLDEAWSILAARGQWPPVNPLSGMTAYSGPFPVLVLRLLGTTDGLAVLRATSVLCNTAVLFLVGLMLDRAHPAKTHAGWSLPLIATVPVWLVVMRTGIEVVMFTPLLVALGLYLLMRGTPRTAFAAGLSWGLLVYNHLVGVCFPLGIAGAWWLTYRRWPRIAYLPALLGALLGLLPRLLSLALYHDKPLEGTAAGYSLLGALGDLRWFPLCLWRTLQGDTVYLRYVGRLALDPWPYWLLGVVFLLPWLGRGWGRRGARAWLVPRPALFVLLSAILSGVLVTLAAPYIAVRFMLLPVIGLTTSLILSAAAAVELDERWRWPMVATALGISILNLFYGINDFYHPWHTNQLGYTQFFLGDRSKRTGNWAYYPKEALVRELVALTPSPQQIVTVPTLERPLRVLLEGHPVRVALPSNVEGGLRSVYVDYRSSDAATAPCVSAAGAPLCFGDATVMAQYYLVYASTSGPHQAP